jgi:hypothetical protein
MATPHVRFHYSPVDCPHRPYLSERPRRRRIEPNGANQVRESATVRIVKRLRAEEIVGHEWAEWYRLSPGERFLESAKVWETYLTPGGSLEPEPDTQSPFFDPAEWRENAPHGRAGVRILRRGGI